MSRLSLTLAILLSLAACDRQAPDAAQGQQSTGPAKPALAGTIDDSHAGALMPVETVRDPAGKTLNLGALQGLLVLLSLWATWCAPCVTEMPQLDALAAELGSSVRVVTVSQDLQGETTVPPFFARMKFTALEPWLDPDNALGFEVESETLPTTILYDASGRELWRVTGAYDWSGAEVRERIAAASR